ncbi:MAG TPA: hypothetical protein VMA72_26325 [Streptosporangiaceae bacterium]|nr:hypothetical protein [Streptosporangiaceae bacterium]
MNRHATLDELARLGADDLRSRKAARIGRHLATCLSCTERNDQLSAVPALLSSVQFPEMPASLATRIDNTLAAEAAQRVAAEPASEAGRRDLPVRSARGRVRRGLDRPRAGGAVWPFPVPATRVLATAAAIIVVGFGGYAIAMHAGVSSSSSPASRAAASAPVASQVSLGQSVTYRENNSSRSIQTVNASTDFQPATLAQMAGVALSEAKMEGMQSGPAKGYGVNLAPTSSANSTLGGPNTASAASAGTVLPQLAGCIDRVIKPGQVVLMVERAKFEGKPATILVTAPASLSGTSQPKEAEIWALGEACSATRSDVLDHVKVAHL